MVLILAGLERTALVIFTGVATFWFVYLLRHAVSAVRRRARDFAVQHRRLTSPRDCDERMTLRGPRPGRSNRGTMDKIKVALVGVGNCASSLVQGRYYYDGGRAPAGLMHERIGGYALPDIDFVLAIDTDARKVGKDLAEAIFAAPNCTTVFPAGSCPQPASRCAWAGCSTAWPSIWRRPASAASSAPTRPRRTQAEIVAALKESGAEVLVNFLPVGSEEATRFYMECALEAGVAVVNCMPVFIASDPAWERRFREKRLPIIGDDIKAQLGATIVHRVLSSLFAPARRHARPHLPAQHRRQYRLHEHARPRPADLEEGIEDRGGAIDPRRPARRGRHPYRPVATTSPGSTTTSSASCGIEGNLFGDVPMNLELRLSVEDSPNSARRWWSTRSAAARSRSSAASAAC